MNGNRIEIRVTGLGGQGVILCTYILGKAAAIYNDLNATMTQSFGPEARGSACSAQLVMDENRILDPYLRHQDILIALSQDGYKKFAHQMNSPSTLIYESELVTPISQNGNDEVKAYGIPATRLAQEVVGNNLTINIIMLGFFAAVCDVIPRMAIEKAIRDSVPAGTEEINMLAFKTGYEYYQEQAAEVVG